METAGKSATLSVMNLYFPHLQNCITVHLQLNVKIKMLAFSKQIVIYEV
jgi:hypothetical protein